MSGMTRPSIRSCKVREEPVASTTAFFVDGVISNPPPDDERPPSPGHRRTGDLASPSRGFFGEWPASGPGGAGERRRGLARTDRDPRKPPIERLGQLPSALAKLVAAAIAFFFVRVFPSPLNLPDNCTSFIGGNEPGAHESYSGGKRGYVKDTSDILDATKRCSPG